MKVVFCALPILASANSCMGIYNIRLPGDKFYHPAQTATTDPGVCCNFCCNNHSHNGGLWQLDDGTCSCFAEPEGEVAHYGTGGWSGRCEYSRPPAVPKGLDTKKFQTDSDPRSIAVYSGSASHSCSYPNDPTTMEDIKKKAYGNSNKKRSGAFGWACGQCGLDNSEDQTKDGPDQTARFCAVVATETSLTFAQQHYKPSSGAGFWEPSCKTPRSEDITIKSIGLGIDNGVYSFAKKSAKCSAVRPPDQCLGSTSRFHPHCECEVWRGRCREVGGGGESGCCSWVKKTEELEATYTWYKMDSHKMDDANTHMELV